MLVPRQVSERKRLYTYMHRICQSLQTSRTDLSSLRMHDATIRTTALSARHLYSLWCEEPQRGRCPLIIIVGSLWRNENKKFTYTTLSPCPEALREIEDWFQGLILWLGKVDKLESNKELVYNWPLIVDELEVRSQVWMKRGSIIQDDSSTNRKTSQHECPHHPSSLVSVSPVRQVQEVQEVNVQSYTGSTCHQLWDWNLCQCLSWFVRVLPEWIYKWANLEYEQSECLPRLNALCTWVDR